MIQVVGKVTADNANVLSGTDIQSAPGPGVVLFWVASTQSDTIVTVTCPPRVASRNILAMLQTSGLPLLSDYPPVALPVNGGEQIALQVDIVTGATVWYVVKFIGKEEM